MFPRRLGNSMSTTDHRIDLEPETDAPDMERVADDFSQIDQAQAAARENNINLTNDHLHQLIRLLKDNLTSTFPFVLILVLKAFYEHSAGIFMVIFFSGSIYHANTVLVHQAALKSSRNVWPVIRVVAILLSSIVLFAYLFRSDKLYSALFFARPSYPHWNLWTLLWVLYSTFCIVKMIVMVVKACLIVWPLTVDKAKYRLTHRRRASLFSLLEYLSQYYISLLTIRPWVHFIMDYDQSNVLFSSFLLFFYATVKLYNLYKSTRDLHTALKQAFQTLPFPSVPISDLRETICPICQSEYQEPIQLTCKHVFCDECVSSWLDRNASCPLCRAKLPIGQANFKDGFTSGYLIWY